MRVVLDRSGRLVVARALRRTLGLRPGQALEIRARDGRLEIQIAATLMRRKKAHAGRPKLTAEQVRDTLERIRR